MFLLFANSSFKPKMKISIQILIFLLLTSISTYAQLSTTGPTRPPGVDEGIRPATRAQVIIPDVPFYYWQHGCGPTSLGMVIGYYNSLGLRFLVEGSAEEQHSAVDDMIAQDNNNFYCSAPYSDHYRDYACPIDNFNNILADKSELGGAHQDNCVADFMRTSRSIDGMMYGWSYNYLTPISFVDYVNSVAPHYIVSTEMIDFWNFSWDAYKAEIDAGRPMIFHVDTEGDAATDHMITAVGYEESGGSRYYGCHDTWDLQMHWLEWREISDQYAWGIATVVTFNLYTIKNTIHVPADYPTIQEALEVADEGDTILVADGIYSGPGNRDILLEGKPIILSENGPEFTIIDCGGSVSEPHRGFIIETGFGPETKIEGFTIRNAYSPGIGGAIKCSNSSLIISNCIFENNYALRGGGMSIYGSTPLITNCTFRQNSANEGGAIYLGNYTAPTIDQCYIEDNDAAYGGGIYSRTAEPLIQNTLFIGNSADNGGGYYNKMMGGTITNCNFCSNSSINGAAFLLSNDANTLTIENSIIAFNTLGEGISCTNPGRVPTLQCTDIFGNEGGDWTAPIADQESQNGNFCADPAFCNMNSGDYTLFVESPCAPENSDCGTLVGIWDVVCLILYTCGDVDNDEAINILDVVYLINYKYKDGPAPLHSNSADVNSDASVNILDIVYLINYKYKGGPMPVCP